MRCFEDVAGEEEMREIPTAKEGAVRNDSSIRHLTDQTEKLSSNSSGDISIFLSRIFQFRAWKLKSSNNHFVSCFILLEIKLLNTNFIDLFFIYFVFFKTFKTFKK